MRVTYAATLNKVFPIYNDSFPGKFNVRENHGENASSVRVINHSFTKEGKLEMEGGKTTIRCWFSKTIISKGIGNDVFFAIRVEFCLQGVSNEVTSRFHKFNCSMFPTARFVHDNDHFVYIKYK